MRTPLRGRGTRHNDNVHETALLERIRRPEPAHLSVRTEPRPLG